MAEAPHRHGVVAAPLLHPHDPVHQARDEGYHVPPQRLDGLAAQGEFATVKGGHRPEQEAHRHGNSLAGPDRAVADEAVVLIQFRLLPPQQRQQLLPAESFVVHPATPLSGRTGCYWLR